MADRPHEVGNPGEWAEEGGPRQKRSRADRARKAFRFVALAGFLLFVFGTLIGLSAGGPSVPATALVLLGLLLAIVGLIAHRLVFWAEVMTNNRPGQGRGSGP